LTKKIAFTLLIIFYNISGYTINGNLKYISVTLFGPYYKKKKNIKINAIINYCNFLNVFIYVRIKNCETLNALTNIKKTNIK